MFSRNANAAERYLPLLVQGAFGEILAFFAETPVIDDPRAGRISGTDAVRSFCEATYRWLRERQAEVAPLAIMHGPTRSVAEAVLALNIDDHLVPLPVAVVAQHDAGPGVSELRVYHSTWPLTGGHRVRAPLLVKDVHLQLPDVVGRYQRGLATADLDLILSAFADDAEAREPSGGDYAYRGREQLRGLYGSQTAIGELPLEHCTVTYDGVRCAIEYNVVRWGKTNLTPQAGIAVYERKPGGLLISARIYDDVSVEELPKAPTAPS